MIPITPCQCPQSFTERQFGKRGNAHKTYEMLKAEWIRKNPEATPEQYETAMRQIARKCGV